MKEIPTKTDVLVVGAGPTGLALAISLQQAGIDYLQVEKLEEAQNTSRAGVIHAHTLEALDSLGVPRELAARGLKLANLTIRDRDRALLKLPFDRLPSSHPYLLMLPQDVTEKILGERLLALGGAIHRGVTVTAGEQGADLASVAVTTNGGDGTIAARYVVGGDGMHSTIRAAAGVEFDGGADADSFVLADVHMDWPLGAGEVSLFFSPEGLVVVAPLPNGTFRVVATLDDAPERPGIQDIQQVMDRRGPLAGPSLVKDVVWSSRFRIHHRLARRYRNGRFFLMGDAAHVHSPAGGQGMNTGLVDAVVLGQLLASVIRGKRPESALDAYQRLRRPAAAQVLELAGVLTSMATVRAASKRAVRNAVLSLVDILSPARRRLLMNLSGLSRKATGGDPGLTSPCSALRKEEAYWDTWIEGNG